MYISLSNKDIHYASRHFIYRIKNRINPKDEIDYEDQELININELGALCGNQVSNKLLTRLKDTVTCLGCIRQLQLAANGHR